MIKLAAPSAVPPTLGGVVINLIGRNMTFRRWEDEVNKLMLKKHGVGIDDIPDMSYRDWWANELTVEEAVKEAIKVTNEGLWV